MASLAMFLAGGAAQGLGTGILANAEEEKDKRAEARAEASRDRGYALQEAFRTAAAARRRRHEEERAQQEGEDKDRRASDEREFRMAMQGRQQEGQRDLQRQKDDAASERLDRRLAAQRETDEKERSPTSMQTRKALMDMVPKIDREVPDPLMPGMTKTVSVPDPVMKQLFNTVWGDRKGTVEYELGEGARAMDAKDVVLTVRTLTRDRADADLPPMGLPWYLSGLRSAGFTFDEGKVRALLRGR